MRPRRLPLAGSTILITGAASGIGRATAQSLHARGAKLVLTDVTEGGLKTLADELGEERALPLVADVTDLAAMTDVVAKSVQRFGRLDVVWANAGVAPEPPATVLQMPAEDFERVANIDFYGVYRTVKAALPEIAKNKGHVLITASIYAYVNGVINSPYATSKAAVAQLGRTLRVELAPHGATAGVLYPGWIQTPIIKSAHGGHPVVTELRKAGFPGPLKKAFPVQQVADAVVRGVERRQASIVVPKLWKPVTMTATLSNPVIDEVLAMRPKIKRLLRTLEAEGR